MRSTTAVSGRVAVEVNFNMRSLTSGESLLRPWVLKCDVMLLELIDLMMRVLPNNLQITHSSLRTYIQLQLLFFPVASKSVSLREMVAVCSEIFACIWARVNATAAVSLAGWVLGAVSEDPEAGSVGILLQSRTKEKERQGRIAGEGNQSKRSF
jgi:hypothetical protein